MESILITGASGRLGGAIVAALAARTSPDRLHALVRSRAAAERFRARGVAAVIGDYTDPASLSAAFDGVGRLVLVSSPALDPEVRLSHHRNVIAAAEGAGVRHIVYTSVFGAPHDPGHSGTEELLPGATILRNGFYTEPFVEAAIADAGSGRVRSATGGGAIASTSIPDLAEAAAIAALDAPAQRVHELRGPAWTYEELAAALSATLGRPILHEQVQPDAVGALAPLHALAARGVLGAETGDLAALLGRPPRSVTEVVADLYRTAVRQR